MGYVRYVGRVGALAVALGVGTAVVTMPGLALAEPSDASNTSVSSPAEKSTPKGSPSASPSTSDVSAATDADSPSAVDSTTSDKGSESPDESGTARVDKKPPRKAKTGALTKTKPRQSSVSTKTVASKDESTDDTPKKQASKTVQSSTATPDPVVHALASVTESAPVTLAGNATRAVAPKVDPPAFSGPLAPLNIVKDVVSTVLGWAGLGPSMTSSPVAPVQEPVLWTLMAFVRREIEQTLHILVPAAGVQHVPTLTVPGPNLLVNPGAELGDPSLSGYSSVTVPGWTVTGTPTVIEYGTQRRFPWPTSSPGPTFPSFLAFPSAACAPPDSGDQFFGGGPVATSSLSQTVDLSAAADQIDSGTVPYELSGDFGGFTIDPSAASMRVEFLDAGGATLGTGRIRPVTALDRWFQTKLLARHMTGAIPVGTRTARVVVTLKDCNPVLGNYNNAYADNLSFTVGATGLAPAPLAPPKSHVGPLDHVFMVYMENKGYGDIVGSPNAPYLNSLIANYAVASNYYALTHPSDPNYYPILGGSDFGVNYNCPANCFDEPNLADLIDAPTSHLKWAGYMDGGGGYSTPTDRLPFLAYSDIYNDPARVASHLFDLSKMADDLNDPASAPNFAWFSADDATNMEGPISTLPGIVQWALSQLTPTWLGGHQYNVAAGDQFLRQTLPMITDSTTWNDPDQKSAIFLTFDEDYNNISLGNGNEGNHVVTVVIASPGAVASGMKTGGFVATNRYDHYSLLRTIELSLGLPSLTNNDEFAQPMNEFWT